MTVLQIVGDNVPHALEEAIIKLPIYAHKEESRNGPVLTVGDPTVITIYRPWERVVLDPVRNANPFFHLAEFVWMISGSNNVKFIEQFNPRMREYADPGTDVHHGAYGHRWRRHFIRDQIVATIERLRRDPTDRRAVMGMWDPATDLDPHNDIPCNTHIYFRVLDNRLHATVCNRSNDLLWGCLGANAVHMTLLHELIARAVGIEQGWYRVFTHNLHVYRERKDWLRLKDQRVIRDDYTGRNRMLTYPLLTTGETYEHLLKDCEEYVSGVTHYPRTQWMRRVFLPAMTNFQARKPVVPIAAPDWDRACGEWLARKEPKQLELPLNIQ